MFFGSAAFAGLHLKVLPVWAESFQTENFAEKIGDRKDKLKFHFSCLIETAKLVWLFWCKSKAERTVPPFKIKSLFYNPLCTSEPGRQVGWVVTERGCKVFLSQRRSNAISYTS